MNTINPLSPIPYVQSSTSKSGGQSKGQNQPQQGQAFQATVVDAKPGNLFTLEIGGNRFSAKTDVPLSVGQVLQLQVTATSPKVELRIISDTLKHFLGHSLTLVGKNLDIGTLVQSLQSTSLPILGSVSPKTIDTLENFQNLQQSSLSNIANGETLKNLVDRLGLSFEALLARGEKGSLGQSLKAALLEISHLFKGAGEISDSTNRLLATLELFQLTQLQMSKENTLIFPLPFTFLEKGYLLIEDYQKHTEESEEDLKDTFTFSLHVTLKELGNLQVNFSQNPEGIYLRFHCDSKEKCAFMQEFTEDLMTSLKDPPILGVSFTDGATDPASEILKHLIPDGRSIVDTRA